MATANGLRSTQNAATPPIHLGKRKRTLSINDESEPTNATSLVVLNEILEAALEVIRISDPSGSVLDYILPPLSEAEGPSSKRRRTQHNNTNHDTISRRLIDQHYTSLDQLMTDVDRIRNELSKETNGHDSSNPSTEDHIEAVWQALSQLQMKYGQCEVFDSAAKSATKSSANHVTLQLLSLRSQTDSGVKQLFTGLPEPRLVGLNELESKTLPNGFDITESAAIDSSGSNSKDKRTFSDAFTPHKMSKLLDVPRVTVTRDLRLDFTSPLSNYSHVNRHDYKQSLLATGQWLKYTTDHPNPLTSNRLTNGNTLTTASLLFKSAYSSFAPTSDHTIAVISEQDRAGKWYQNFSQYSSPSPVIDISSTEANSTLKTTEFSNSEEFELDNDFESIIDNYVSESDADYREESEKLLDEVSELIQTLCSHQINRDLDSTRGPTSGLKLSKDEFATYELLRSSLQLLVNSLPPHAVAKLNGDQLESLNISTNIVIVTPEVNGTSQADDYTLRRQRITQAPNSAVGRVNNSLPARASYGAPNTTYNTQAQPYSRGVSTNSYVPRSGAAVYNTPRPSAQAPLPHYSQQPFRSGSTNYNTPTAQQFQKPIVNGYSQPGTLQPGYTSRTTQPNYQPRTQDRGNAPTHDLSQISVQNGLTPQAYQGQSFSRQTLEITQSPTPSHVSLQQRLQEQNSSIQQPHQQADANEGMSSAQTIMA